jgi:hypothetical protein
MTNTRRQALPCWDGDRQPGAAEQGMAASKVSTGNGEASGVDAVRKTAPAFSSTCLAQMDVTHSRKQSRHQHLGLAEPGVTTRQTVRSSAAARNQSGPCFSNKCLVMVVHVTHDREQRKDSHAGAS